MRRKTVIVTGLIGSGKSAVCALLRERGIPVYDSDARTKRLYDSSPVLVERLEAALGIGLRGEDGRLDRKALAARIFSEPLFDGLADAVVLVTAPEEVRLSRVRERDSLSEEAVRARMSAQRIPSGKVNVELSNDGTEEALRQAVDAVFFRKNSYICKILEEE